MATSFEFLPRSARRIAFDRRLPVIFFVTLFVFGLIGFYFKKTSGDLQIDFEREASMIRQRTEEIESRTIALLPDGKEIANLEAEIEENNFALIGPRTSWAELFQTLEEELPDDAVVAKIENPKTGTSVFQAGENEIRLLVVVLNQDSANSFYRKISSKKCFQSLSFTPKGDYVYGGRKGLGIEIVFKFEGFS